VAAPDGSSMMTFNPDSSQPVVIAEDASRQLRAETF
jgi:hypothetical protein